MGPIKAKTIIDRRIKWLETKIETSRLSSTNKRTGITYDSAEIKALTTALSGLDLLIKVSEDPNLDQMADYLGIAKKEKEVL